MKKKVLLISLVSCFGEMSSNHVDKGASDNTANNTNKVVNKALSVETNTNKQSDQTDVPIDYNRLTPTAADKERQTESTTSDYSLETKPVNDTTSVEVNQNELSAEQVMQEAKRIEIPLEEASEQDKKIEQDLEAKQEDLSDPIELGASDVKQDNAEILQDSTNQVNGSEIDFTSKSDTVNHATLKMNNNTNELSKVGVEANNDESNINTTNEPSKASIEVPEVEILEKAVVQEAIEASPVVEEKGQLSNDKKMEIVMSNFDLSKSFQRIVEILESSNDEGKANTVRILVANIDNIVDNFREPKDIYLFKAFFEELPKRNILDKPMLTELKKGIFNKSISLFAKMATVTNQEEKEVLKKRAEGLADVISSAYSQEFLEKQLLEKTLSDGQALFVIYRLDQIKEVHINSVIKVSSEKNIGYSDVIDMLVEKTTKEIRVSALEQLKEFDSNSLEYFVKKAAISKSDILNSLNQSRKFTSKDVLAFVIKQLAIKIADMVNLVKESNLDENVYNFLVERYNLKALFIKSVSEQLNNKKEVNSNEINRYIAFVRDHFTAEEYNNLKEQVKPAALKAFEETGSGSDAEIKASQARAENISNIIKEEYASAERQKELIDNFNNTILPAEALFDIYMFNSIKTEQFIQASRWNSRSKHLFNKMIEKVSPSDLSSIRNEINKANAKNDKDSNAAKVLRYFIIELSKLENK